MATNLSLFDCKANGEDNRLGLAEREEKDRRVGVVRGTVMAAAIAIEGVASGLSSFSPSTVKTHSYHLFLCETLVTATSAHHGDQLPEPRMPNVRSQVPGSRPSCDDTGEKHG